MLLPLHKDAATLPLAFASLQAQTLRDWHCLLLLNGADAATAACAAQLARTDDRCEIVPLQEASLPAALNTGLLLAQRKGFSLAARMDGDDWCFPQRFAQQVQAMRESDVVALGSAWEVWDHAMHKRQCIMHAPPTPAEMRWRLLLANPLAHGSMMLRVSRVLEAGGYDLSMHKAQDYDLWLRLARRGPVVGALASVLYRHRSKGAASGAAVLQQARAASSAQLRAWSNLNFDDGSQLPELLAMYRAGERSEAATRERVAALLTAQSAAPAGPSREAMMAYLMLGGDRPSAAAEPAPAESHAQPPDGVFASRVAQRAKQLAAIAPGKVFLFPAGRVARRAVLEHELDADVVAGLVDDHPDDARDALRAAARGQRERALPRVLATSQVPSDAVVLLATHAHAQALWDATVFLRARGVLIERVDAVPIAMPSAATSHQGLLAGSSSQAST